MKIYLVEELTGDGYENSKSVIGCYSNSLTAISKAKEYYNTIKTKLPYPEGFDEDGYLIDEDKGATDEEYLECSRIWNKNWEGDNLLDVYISEIEVDSDINENLTNYDRISISDLIEKGD